MKYFQLPQKKSNFVASRKQPHGHSDYNLQSPADVQISNHVFKQKRDFKTNGKAIQADLGIFTHIPTYSGIIRHIRAYSGIIQAYSEPCVILVDSELWYIQNSGIFKTRDIFKTLVYPKFWHIQNQRYIQNRGLLRTTGIFRTGGIPRTLSYIYDRILQETDNGYNYFRKLKLFSQYQLFMSFSS